MKGVAEYSGSESIEIVWAHGENGGVPYGQQGVDVGRKCRESTGQTEIRLDGWRVGDLEQQRDGGGGCDTMRERQEVRESPGEYVDDLVSRAIFDWPCILSDRPSAPEWIIAWRVVGYRYMIPWGKL